MFALVSRLCRPVVRQVLRQRNAWSTPHPCAACVQVRGLATKGEATDVDHSRITNQEWEKRLKPEQYFVTREKGTEAPFTGKYVNHNEKGVYTCVCCGSELFGSEAKFDSGSGWPSFHTALGGDGKDPRMSNVLERPDNSMGMVRTEVLCKKCDAHLGHVFEDGPQPTGLRYCINSVALQFIGQRK